MAVIAIVKSTGERGIVLGAGYGMYAHTSSAIRSVRRGQEQLLALCNKEGQVSWHDHDDVQVLSVDGKTPYQLLGGEGYR